MDANLSEADWATFNKFFERSWFPRVWVVQEAVFAAKFVSLPTIFVFGAHEISWDVMVTVSEVISLGFSAFLGFKSIQTIQGSTIFLVNEVRSSRSARDYPDIINFLWRTRSLRATDPRDKCSALLGMLRGENTDSFLLGFQI
jgi:hypothetical protein